MRLVIFEDAMFDQFFPLTYMRPTFELKCGINSLGDKIRAAFPGRDYAYWVRSYHREVLSLKYPDTPVNSWDAVTAEDTLWVNSRVLMKSGSSIPAEGPEECAMVGDCIAWFRLTPATVRKIRDIQENDERKGFWDAFGAVKEGLAAAETGVDTVSFPWDLINHNPAMLADDFPRFLKPGIDGEVHPQAAVIGPDGNISIGKGSSIHPFAVIDASGGPVMIGSDVTVQPFTRIEGPVYIGDGTQIMAGAHVREGTTLGPVCRIGGEVEEAIVHGYANKYHDGFLGHAYVCEWVNLGAITTNSDLRNDYGPVKVYCKGEILDSGSSKVGLFIGDHSKTSIGCMFNTGAVCGVMNNIINTGGLLPRIIPSFVFMQGRNASLGKGLDWLINTARLAMARRDVQLTDADERLLRYLYDLTHKERNDVITRSM